MRKTLIATAAAIALPALAQAHFLLEYTTDTMIDRPGDVPVKLIFWHPMSAGHVMDLEKPQEFYVIHNGEKTDLLGTLEPVGFNGGENEGAAFKGSVPVKRSGDYVLVTVPQPYYEESEDIFIQQITKAFLNRNELPTDWSEPVGLPAEIVPLNKPYNVMVGSTFTGRVLSDGEPVAGAEIEIEYMASEPDMEGATTSAASVAPPPGGAIVAISDDNGYFTFGVPKAGHWGFAALGVGPATEHEGKELSQDAVIWIRAWDLEQAAPMHIVDGALSNPVVIGGAVAAAGGIAIGLRSLPLERIPVAGVLSASFFVASLIHVPIGPSSVHLILNGLAGLLLGWAAFPALFVGLLLQAVFFGFGGLTVLGVNTFNIAMPAVLTWLLFGRLAARGTPLAGAIWAGIGGAFAIVATTAFVAMSLALSGDAFIPAAKLVIVAHLPVMAIEGLLTGFAVFLARKVKPELFTSLKGARA